MKVLSFILLLLSVKLSAESAPLLKEEYRSPVVDSLVRVISPNAQYVLFASYRGPEMEVIDLTLKKRVLTIPVPQLPKFSHPLAGEIEVSADALPAVFSPASNSVLIGQADGFLEEYFIGGGMQSRMVSDAAILSLATVHSPAGNPLLFVVSQTSISLWDLASSYLMHRIPNSSGSSESHRGSYHSVFNIEGTRLALSSDVWLEMFDISGGNQEQFYFDPGAHFLSGGNWTRKKLLLGTFLTGDEYVGLQQGLEELVLVKKSADTEAERIGAISGDYLGRKWGAVSSAGRLLLLPMVAHGKMKCARIIELAQSQVIAHNLPAPNGSRDLLDDYPSVAITPDGKTGIVFRAGRNILQVWSMP